MAEQKIKLIIDSEGRAGGISVVVNGLNKLKGAANDAGSRLDFLSRGLTRFFAPITAMLSGAALARFAQTTIQNADALAKAAQSAGLAADKFSALAYAGKLADLEIGDLTTAAKGLAEWMSRTGRIGEDFLSVLLEQADEFAAMPDGLEKVRLAVDRFGRSGQAMIPLLNQGSQALREQFLEAQQFGAVVGPRFSTNAQQFNDNLTRIGMIFRGVFNILSDALLPEFLRLQEAFINWVKSSGAHIAVVDTLIDIYKGFAVILATTAAGFNLVLGPISRFVGAMSAGATVSEAWAAAGDSANETLDGLAERIDKILKLGRRSDPGGNSAASLPLVDILENQRMLLENNANEIGIINARANESEISRNRALRSLYAERLQMLAEMEKRIEQRFSKISGGGDKALFTQGYAANQKELNSILKEREELLTRISQIDSQTFFGRMAEGVRALTEEFDNLGASVADVMLNGIKSSIDAVANGIWAVIDGTRTWGEIFLQVGRQIISDLIRIALQETIVFGVKKALAYAWKSFMSLMRGQDVVEANATEAAKSPALAANATLASIASWGTAVVVGLAAIAGVLASMGAFEAGGVVHGGRQIIQVNESGTEAVLNARATARLGESGVAALNAGDFDLAARMANRMAEDSPSYPSMRSSEFGSSAGGEMKLTVIVVANERDAVAAMASAAGRAVIVNTVRDSKMEIGIPT